MWRLTAEIWEDADTMPVRCEQFFGETQEDCSDLLSYRCSSDKQFKDALSDETLRLSWKELSEEKVKERTQEKEGAGNAEKD